MHTAGLDALAHVSHYALQQLQQPVGVHNPHLAQAGPQMKHHRQHPYGPATRATGAAGHIYKRTSRACNQCSQLKQRCNGQHPCARCTEYGRGCEYIREQKKRRKAPRKNLAPVAAAVATAQSGLESRVSELEAEVSEAKAAATKAEQALADAQALIAAATAESNEKDEIYNSYRDHNSMSSYLERVPTLQIQSPTSYWGGGASSCIRTNPLSAYPPSGETAAPGWVMSVSSPPATYAAQVPRHVPEDLDEHPQAPGCSCCTGDGTGLI